MFVKFTHREHVLRYTFTKKTCHNINMVYSNIIKVIKIGLIMNKFTIDCNNVFCSSDVNYTSINFSNIDNSLYKHYDFIHFFIITTIYCQNQSIFFSFFLNQYTYNYDNDHSGIN